jgi:hypothetical protein
MTENLIDQPSLTSDNFFEPFEVLMSDREKLSIRLRYEKFEYLNEKKARKLESPSSSET